MSGDARRLSDVDADALLADRQHDHLLLLDRPKNDRKTKLHLPVDEHGGGETTACGGPTTPDDPTFRQVRPDDVVRDLELCQRCDPAVIVNASPPEARTHDALIEMDVEEFDAIVDFKQATQGGGSA